MYVHTKYKNESQRRALRLSSPLVIRRARPNFPKNCKQGIT